MITMYDININEISIIQLLLIEIFSSIKINYNNIVFISFT